MKKLILSLIFGIFLVGFVIGAIDWGEETSRDFKLTTGAPICDPDGNTWNGGESSSLNNCNRASEGAEVNCCPEGYYCSNDNCVLIDREVNSCSDYKTQEQCEGYTKIVAYKGVENLYGLKCGTQEYNPISKCIETIDNCKCVWRGDDEFEEGGVCEGIYNISEYCGDDPDGRNNLGYCRWFTKQVDDKCDTLGTRIYSVNATWIGRSTSSKEKEVCKSSIREELCGASIIKLPVFGFMNFILVCLGIFGFYLFRD